MSGRTLTILIAAALGALAGCRGGDMERLLDQDSQQRLAALGKDARVLISLRGETQTPQVPTLGKGDRVLDHAGHSVLLDVDRATLPMLADADGVQDGTIWGGSDVIGRIDPPLRAQLLGALDKPAEVAPLAMVGRFDASVSHVTDAIAACGGKVNSVAGGIVTLEAPARSVLRILAVPGLVELKKPNVLNPLGS